MHALAQYLPLQRQCINTALVRYQNEVALQPLPIKPLRLMAYESKATHCDGQTGRPWLVVVVSSLAKAVTLSKCQLPVSISGQGL